jgi:soluble lytic murein transglycosylase-like protein
MVLMHDRVLRIACFVGIFMTLAAGASAELVFFTNGRALSVKGHRADGDAIVLLLRGGGEVTCPRALVAQIAPDEVPMPDAGAALSALAAAIAVPAQYNALIDQAAARHNVDVNLVRAVIQVESAYRAQARSRKGAVGLMQLMPDTARRFAVMNPYDPGANIEGGTKYLKFLLDRFGSADYTLTLAAYNAGEAAVEKFRGVPPYAETRNYVQAVLSLLRQ